MWKRYRTWVSSIAPIERNKTLDITVTITKRKDPDPSPSPHGAQTTKPIDTTERCQIDPSSTHTQRLTDFYWIYCHLCEQEINRPTHTYTYRHRHVPNDHVPNTLLRTKSWCSLGANVWRGDVREDMGNSPTPRRWKECKMGNLQCGRSMSENKWSALYAQDMIKAPGKTGWSRSTVWLIDKRTKVEGEKEKN